MGQDICIRKDEKPLGYDWECGHEELYVRVNMYYNGSLYVGLWQKQKECEEKLELFGDLTIGVMGFLRPGQAIISDCGAKAKVAFVEKYKLGKDIVTYVDSRLLFVLWENLEDFVQSGIEFTLFRDVRLLVL